MAKQTTINRAEADASAFFATTDHEIRAVVYPAAFIPAGQHIAADGSFAAIGIGLPALRGK